jgi:putative hydrolase of the HAD superfamily
VLGIVELFDGIVSIEDMRMYGELRPKPDARMFRRLLARLRVPPVRCVLVEDNLRNQRAARRVGMKTVWMQRWTRPAATHAHVRWTMRPAYVDLRARHLRMLLQRPL